MAQEIADSTLLDTWGSGGNIVEPDISKIIEGWQLGEQPPHEYMNWLQNTFGSKLNHILKNGVANWNNTTQYLAGSSVQHNGNVWLCKTTNTNSAPTDANANWKRIITIESLTTVLNGYVKNSGNETIAGVKTFSSFPITPSSAPTTDYQVANKAYVDSVAGGYKDFGLGNISMQNVLDLNNLPATGFYIFGGGTANRPAEIVYGTIITIKRNTMEETQVAYSTVDAITVTRYKVSNVWSSWIQVANKKYVDDIALGINQTWQDVTASRSSGVTYVNTTGKPIQVNIAHNAGSANFTFTVDGNVVASIIDDSQSNHGFTGIIVPNGSTYSTSATPILIWTELR